MVSVGYFDTTKDMSLHQRFGLDLVRADKVWFNSGDGEVKILVHSHETDGKVYAQRVITWAAHYNQPSVACRTVYYPADERAYAPVIIGDETMSFNYKDWIQECEEWLPENDPDKLFFNFLDKI